MLTAARLREVLDYNPSSGTFTWRPRGLPHFDEKWAGRAAGAITPKGYVRVSIDQNIYAAHRLAWLFMTGGWPADQIDHINGIRDDNRFANLREATRTQNNQNVRRPVTNRSGAKGVSFCRNTGLWRAIIRVNGETKHLGRFDSVGAARAAYEQASRRFHGEFARVE